MKLKFLLLLILVNFCVKSFGQKKTMTETETDKKYIKLINKVNDKKTQASKKKYLDSLIKVTKKEKKYQYLFFCYHTHGLIRDDELALTYYDSILELSKLYSFEDQFYPRDAYQAKGDFFFQKRYYKRALSNFLKVSEYAKKYNDKLVEFNVRQSIGFVKRITGDFKDAVRLQKKNLAYASSKKGDSMSYLKSLMSLANIYNDMKLPDSSMVYNKLGINESKKLKLKTYLNHFSLNSGISFYLKNQYQKAIDTIEKFIPYYEKFKSKRNLDFAYYYCGEAYLKINNHEKAINYFKKTDTLFEKKGNMYPIMRTNFVRLVDYYKKKKDYNHHLKYLNKLIRFDSILYSQNIYLNKELINKYDIPKIQSEKKVVLKEMKRNKRISFFVILSISTILFIAFLLLFFQSKQKAKYKKRFHEIIKQHETEKKQSNLQKKKTSNVPDEIVENILLSLNKFEEKNQFIMRDITLVLLAKKLNTNSNYLSKVINTYKEKNFTNYINELRIEYAIEKMKTDVTFRKYTIKAIALDVGFKSSDSFSKAFLKQKEIKPSYFLRELLKKNPLH